MSSNTIGHILWTDLTVPDAVAVRDFYKEVVGWTDQGLDMGGYEDFMMMAPAAPKAKSAEEAVTVAGICHARGANEGLPAQWLNYFGVADLDASRAAVERLGGKLRSDIRTYGKSRYCVIEDPAGAVCAIFEQRD